MTVYKTYIKWKEHKDHVNELEDHQQNYDSSPFFWWKADDNKYINSAIFTLNCRLYNLPIDIIAEGQYQYENYEVTDLQCPYQTLGLDGCRYRKEKTNILKKCWCETIESLKKNGRARVVFKLKNTSKETSVSAYNYRSDFYIWIIAKIDPTKDKFSATLRVEFGHSIFVRDPENYIEIYNNNNLKETITINDGIATTNFKYSSFNLPKNIISHYYSSSYHIPSYILCNYGNNNIINKIECPNAGNCFCSLMNQLRSEGVAYINFRLDETDRDGKIASSNYRMKINAIRDPKNHDYVNFNISYEYDYKTNYPPVNHTANQSVYYYGD